MFKAPFSIKGRIARTEFGLTLVIFSVFEIVFLLTLLASNSQLGYICSLVILIVLFWFRIAQGTKRCHDIGISGFYQLIPFYTVVLLAQKGNPQINKYGVSPKTVIVNDVCKVLSVTNGNIIVENSKSKRLLLQNVSLPSYVREGDLIRHIENGNYIIVDTEGNLLFRM